MRKVHMPSVVKEETELEKAINAYYASAFKAGSRDWIYSPKGCLARKELDLAIKQLNNKD